MSSGAFFGGGGIVGYNVTVGPGTTFLLALLGSTAPEALSCDSVLPPEGMICVQGQGQGQAPAATATFFIDSAPAARSTYRSCVRDEVCPNLQKLMRGKARHAVTGAPARAERRFCVWAGKRLPTGDEFKRAVQARAVPTGPTAAGIRCVASTATLHRQPYWHLRRRPAPAIPQPPSASDLMAFGAIRHDEQVKDIPTCAGTGIANHDCRDPMSYVHSNEGLRSLFARYVRNLGGGYVGIGADQNYDFIAEARSEWVWLFDYDPAVVAVHHIIRAVVSNARSPEAFLTAFDEANVPRTRRWIRKSLADEPDEIKLTMRVFTKFRADLLAAYQSSLEPRKNFPKFGWLANPRHYRYIRLLFKQERITIRRGNLLTDVVMPDIARSAEALGVPIRVYYDSNAADQWTLTDQYRTNVAGLPFDEYGVALRTMLAKYLNVAVDEKATWVYAVHGAAHMQRAFRAQLPERTRSFMIDSLPAGAGPIFTIALPQVPPDEQHSEPPEARVAGELDDTAPQ